MPITNEMFSKRKPAKRNGEQPKPEDMPGPAQPIAPPTKRVRMLRRVQSRFYGILEVGKTADIPVQTADTWIGMGLAEEDKSLGGPPEIKN